MLGVGMGWDGEEAQSLCPAFLWFPAGLTVAVVGGLYGNTASQGKDEAVG